MQQEFQISQPSSECKLSRSKIDKKKNFFFFIITCKNLNNIGHFSFLSSAFIMMFCGITSSTRSIIKFSKIVKLWIPKIFSIFFRRCKIIYSIFEIFCNHFKYLFVHHFAWEKQEPQLLSALSENLSKQTSLRFIYFILKLPISAFGVHLDTKIVSHYEVL